MDALNIVLLITAVLIIILVLLQSGKADDAAKALSGGKSNLFADRKERGGELVLSRVTMILGALFIIISFILTY